MAMKREVKTALRLAASLVCAAIAIAIFGKEVLSAFFVRWNEDALYNHAFIGMVFAAAAFILRPRMRVKEAATDATHSGA